MHRLDFRASSVGRLEFYSLGLRPAPNTALALGLLGVSLLGVSLSSDRASAHASHARAWPAWAAAGALVVSAAALIGHAYGAGFLYGRRQIGGMALPTALALAALSIGALFARPARGMAAMLLSGSGAGQFLRRLLPAAALVPVALGWLTLAAHRAALLDVLSGTSLLVVTLVGTLAAILVTQARHVHEFEADREAALQEAQAASRAKSAFLATMSHELRTPLNAIDGYAELMELEIHGPVTGAQRQALERIRRSQRHLLGIINDVLNFARLESGAVAFAIGPVDLGALLASVEPLIAPQLHAKHLSYAVRIDPGTPPALADPEKLRQVLLNLLSNAIKFTPEGGHLSLQCRAGATHVAITVCDSGVGIPADKLEAIFDPFVQVRADLARPYDGTGLGLAISRDLARGMGGDLPAESRLGGGSTFTLALRRASRA